jgi:hypothetical protein
MRLIWPATWIFAAAAVLTDCGTSTNSADVATPRLTNPLPAARLLPAHPDRRKSWVASDAATAPQLLFVSDVGTYDVDIFALPKMTLKGTLSGFDEPLGECPDNRGNVWITNYLKHEVLEYSRAGIRLNKIARAHLAPNSCAVNPLNGAIAVTDINGPEYQPGEVLVYSKPSAAPVVLHNPVQASYYYAAYDPKGDLWVDGYDAVGHFILSKCGASRCSTVDLSGGSIFEGAAIAWDKLKRTWVVFDQYCRDTPSFCSYPVSTRGVIGAPTFYLSYTGGGLCDLAQAALTTSGTRSIAVGADNEYTCSSYKVNTIDAWAYPAGGTPLNYHAGTVIYPWGAAVSVK